MAIAPSHVCALSRGHLHEAATGLAFLVSVVYVSFISDPLQSRLSGLSAGPGVNVSWSHVRPFSPGAGANVPGACYPEGVQRHSELEGSFGVDFTGVTDWVALSL